MDLVGVLALDDAFDDSAAATDKAGIENVTSANATFSRTKISENDKLAHFLLKCRLSALLSASFCHSR